MFFLTLSPLLHEHKRVNIFNIPDAYPPDWLTDFMKLWLRHITKGLSAQNKRVLWQLDKVTKREKIERQAEKVGHSHVCRPEVTSLDFIESWPGARKAGQIPNFIKTTDTQDFTRRLSPLYWTKRPPIGVDLLAKVIFNLSDSDSTDFSANENMSKLL